eukprot:jgi/Phyca11/4500/fgenesh1_pm.PHYCAscaffold_2_\
MVGKRMSLALTATIPCDDIPLVSPQRNPPIALQEERPTSWYKPPARREQLLRGRMRVLALVKLVHGQHGIDKAHAELELAEAYARMNLWKQAEVHASCAANLLREIESQMENLTSSKGQKDNGKLLQVALEFCYEAQCDESSRGRVGGEELVAFCNKDPQVSRQNQLLAAAFSRESLEKVFGAEPTLHWQQMLLRLEEMSQELHQHLTFVSARLPPGVAQMLNALFVSLDTAEDGIAPFHTFLDRLQTANTDLSSRKSSAASYIQTLCTTLQRVLNRVSYHSISWTEVLTLGANSNIRLPSSDESSDASPPALLARVKLLLSRVYLRRGRLEEAVRYVQSAVVSREKINTEGSDLVHFYLVAAEAQARRGRQLRILGQQARRDRAEKWLQTTEGSRHLRSRALEEVELASGTGNPLLSKKEAEARARTVLIQELTVSAPPTLTINRPSSDYEALARSLMEEALENCSKAWELQESHFGRDHISTAAVHVTLAQVHLLRSNEGWKTTEENEEITEAVRSFSAAIEIFENACSGIVPASAFLHLELAKLYQQDRHNQDKSRSEYELVGRFFATFSNEFQGSESTKRECSTLALDAFRQWLALSRSNSSVSLDDQRLVLEEMHSVSVNGYGEFSIEACESSAELARMLHRLATSRQGRREPQSEIQEKLRTATKLLRSASYIAESLLGANDRRTRKIRKDANDIETQMRSTLVDGQDEDGHEWLTI